MFLRNFSPDELAIVEGKTVGVLLHGQSVDDIVEHSDVLMASDIVWISLNNFSYFQTLFLDNIQSHLALIFCVADNQFSDHQQSLAEYNKRFPDCVIFYDGDDTGIEVFNHSSRLIRHEATKSWPQPNTLLLILHYLSYANPAKVLLFGADGFIGDESNMADTYADNAQIVNRVSNIMQDTIHYNAIIESFFNHWLQRKAQDMPEVWNVNGKSHLNFPPAIAWSELAHYLNNNKKDTWLQLWNKYQASKEQIRKTTLHQLDNQNNEEQSERLLKLVQSGLIDEAATLAYQQLTTQPTQSNIIVFRVILIHQATCQMAVNWLKENATSTNEWMLPQLERSLWYFNQWGDSLGAVLHSEG